MDVSIPRTIDSIRLRMGLVPPDRKEAGLITCRSVAENITLIMPFYSQLDRVREAEKGNTKIGTTGRGIGIAYEDKGEYDTQHCACA